LITSLKRLVGKTLFYRFSKGEWAALISATFCLFTAVSFSPYFYSMLQWSGHRTTTFEGDSVVLPRRWVPGEMGHLLSIRRPGMNILFPYTSTIVIDPFAERWPADKVKMVSDLWLRFHGKPLGGSLEIGDTDRQITFDSSLRCVSPSSSSQRHYVLIACLSTDSVHSFEFFGERDAVPDFAEVSALASHVASEHPGTVLRK